MLEPDYIFGDGFDKYLPYRGTNHGVNDAAQFLIRGEWTGIDYDNGIYFAAGLSPGGGGTAPPGNSLAIFSSTSGADLTAGVYKSLPGTFKRFIGGVTIKYNLGSFPAFVFMNGKAHSLSIGFAMTTGRIQLRRGNSYNSTVIAESAESVSVGSTNCLEVDIEMMAGATGKYKVWLNGVLTSLDATGVDISAAATDGFNAIGLYNGLQSGSDTAYFDHFYGWFWEDTGIADLYPSLENPVVETQWAIEDYACDFEVGPGILGNALRTLATSAAVGANLYLRPFLVEEDCDLQSISFLPATTSAIAKYKPLAYADDGSGGAGIPGAPAALLSDGAESVGSTAAAIKTMALTTPSALTAGDIVWLGWFGDTNISVYHDFTGTEGIRDAVTYASGAPNPPTTITTAQPVFYLYGNVTGAVSRWPQINQRTPSQLSYNLDTAPGSKDLFRFDPLSVTPTHIYHMAVKAACLRTDAGARTVAMKTLSGAVETDGNTGAIAPPLTVTYVPSYWWTDPATDSEWDPSAVNDSLSGYEIIT